MSDEGVNLITKACSALKCPVDIFSKALLLYHNVVKHFDSMEFSLEVISVAAVYLAAVMHNENANSNDMILELLRVWINPDTETEEFNEAKDNLIQASMFLMSMLGNRIYHDVAFQYLELYSAVFKDEIPLRLSKERWNLIIVNAWRILLDIYKSDLCLKYSPEQIAIFSIYMCLQLYQMNSEIFKVWIQEQQLYMDTDVFLEFMIDYIECCFLSSYQ